LPRIDLSLRAGERSVDELERALLCSGQRQPAGSPTAFSYRCFSSA
jgi:hypothetical protein